jgi:hypothetical protein
MDGWTGNSLIMWYRAQQTHARTYGQRLPRLRRFVSSFPHKRFLFPPSSESFFGWDKNVNNRNPIIFLAFGIYLHPEYENRLNFLGGARVEQSQSWATFLCVNIENSQLLIYCVYLLTLVRFNLKFQKTACVIDAQTCRYKRRSPNHQKVLLKKEK